MAELLRFRELLAKLRDRAAAARKESGASVIVGYAGASYGIFVHENLEAHHTVGQAKFLEQPARENRDKYAQLVVDQLKKGRTMGQALVIAGMSLQADSQRLVPVDTGNLRASAFTRLEEKS